MLPLYLFPFICFAITGIITQEYIFHWLRKRIKFKLLHCPNCFSFWAGLMVSFLFPPLYSIYLSPILYGLISYTICRITMIWLMNKGEMFVD